MGNAYTLESSVNKSKTEDKSSQDSGVIAHQFVKSTTRCAVAAKSDNMISITVVFCFLWGCSLLQEQSAEAKQRFWPHARPRNRGSDVKFPGKNLL